MLLACRHPPFLFGYYAKQGVREIFATFAIPGWGNMVWVLALGRSRPPTIILASVWHRHCVPPPCPLVPADSGAMIADNSRTALRSQRFAAGRFFNMIGPIPPLDGGGRVAVGPIAAAPSRPAFPAGAVRGNADS